MQEQWWQTIEATIYGEPQPVAGLTVDSRQVQPGWAFVAVPGATSDGHAYLASARERGATTLVVQEDHRDQWEALVGSSPLVVVRDTRAVAGPLASAVYSNPSHRLRLVGITGTDGKTTSSHLTAHVLDGCGLNAGFLTSVGFETGTGFELNESHMTTLEGPLIQAHLAQALLNGRETMVVEASSEGLAQHRLDGSWFDVAVFTNLSRDHLDFHGTMESYLAAKGLLFMLTSRSPEKGFPKAAVLNKDDKSAAYLRDITSLPIHSYGLGPDADIQATDIEVEGFKLRFLVNADGLAIPAEAPLIGRFNVYNSLIAIAVARSQGADLGDAVAALASFPGVPGRLESIDAGQPFSVYVDIASTPAALENVLTALRPGTRGKLWVVFGAAGGRDPARRDGMGRVAGWLADISILTNEDPRDEDPEEIIEAIASGLREMNRVEDRHFFRRPNRREAIEFAFANAGPGDTVLLAGKATETSIITGATHEPWDERAIAREILGGS